MVYVGFECRECAASFVLYTTLSTVLFVYNSLYRPIYFLSWTISPLSLFFCFGSFKKSYQQLESEPAPWSRLLDRSGPFKQSRGIWNIKKVGGREGYNALYWNGLTFTLLDSPSWKIFILILLVYNLIWTCFGLFFWCLRIRCDMDFSTFIDAMFFSMETSLTIGSVRLSYVIPIL